MADRDTPTPIREVPATAQVAPPEQIHAYFTDDTLFPAEVTTPDGNPLQNPSVRSLFTRRTSYVTIFQGMYQYLEEVSEALIPGTTKRGLRVVYERKK